MSESLELAIKVAMESTSFQKQMGDINSQMKLAQAEFANASSKVEGFSNTIAGGKAKVENLTQQLELQKQKVTMYTEAHDKAKATLEKNAQANVDLANKINATKSAYDTSVTATGKNSEESKKLKEELDKLNEKYKTSQNTLVNNQKAVNNYTIQLNNAQKGVNNLDKELQASSKEVEEHGGKWAELKEKLASAGESWNGVGTKLAGVGKTIATGMAVAGASFIGLATAGVTMSDDLNGALNGLQASTGATDESMDGMKTAMLDIYNNNFGESFEDIGTAMGSIAQQSGLSGTALEGVTQNALLMRDTFNMDVNESFRSAKMLMDQFGVSSEQAYNLLAQGAQNGLDKNGNLLDSVNEYSVQFKQMGFSSEEMFNMFSNGAKSGVFDVDKLGDAVKEFGIRSKDGSKSTTEAFQALGLDAGKLSADFAKGGETGKQAFQTVNDALKNCKDPLVQNQAGTALWGRHTCPSKIVQNRGRLSCYNYKIAI